LDRRQTLLFNLEDLAHEQRLGKISDDDYARLQTAYKKDLVAVMDQMENSDPPTDFQAFMLARLTPHPFPPPQGGREQCDGPPPQGGREKACFQCKVFYQANYSFCPKCGGPLTVSA
jgi:hypothetical protein